MVSPDAPIPDAGRVRAVPADDAGDAAQWNDVARIRKQRPGWVVIWLARKGEFRARPGTVAIGATPRELTDRMDEIQRAASSPKHPVRS